MWYIGLDVKATKEMEVGRECSGAGMGKVVPKMHKWITTVAKIHKTGKTDYTKMYMGRWVGGIFFFGTPTFILQPKYDSVCTHMCMRKY